MSNRKIDLARRAGPKNSRVALALGIWFGLLIVDALVLSRRWSGALTVPLNAPVAWASGLAISAASIAALVFWRRSGQKLNSRIGWLPAVSAIFWPMLWGAAFSPGLSPFAWGGLTAGVGMLLCATGLVCLWVGAPESSSQVSGVDESAPEFQITQAVANLAESATDWQRRIVVEDGEAIEGNVRIQFAPGQKEAIAHLAFCPPFSTVPEVHAEDSEGGDLEIRSEAIYPFGARLTVRRSSAFDIAASYDIAYTAAVSEQSAAA
ncbi:MAG: hypothetical protein U0872_14965 [Planctomycetaceae bacterium]